MLFIRLNRPERTEKMINKLDTLIPVAVFLSAWICGPVVIFLSALISTVAFAASDGTAGATSTGTSDVSLTINDRVQITSVADIALGAYGGSGAMTGQSNYCVFRNGGDNYKLNLTADTGAFQVDSVATGDSVAFTVRVDDDADASDGEALTYGVDSAVALVGAPTLNCGGGDNASMYVSFAEAALLAVSSANDYTATVTLLVSPI